MYYKGKEGYNSVTFLKEVHEIMYQKYGKKNQEEINNAIELQKFFSNFKKDLLSSSPVTNIINQNILNFLMQQGYSIPELQTLFTTPGTKGGFAFEKGLGLVILSFLKNLTTDDIQLKDLIIGGDNANIAIDNWSGELTQQLFKKIGTQTEKYFEEESQKEKYTYLQDVSGKIDVQGMTVKVTYAMTPEVEKIYTLLKDATFTAKSYITDYLGMGKSDLYRAIVGPLLELGYDQRTSESALYAGLELLKKGNANVASHFYHLRFLYELTGYGLKYGGRDLGTAKYLIYNNPNGDIYVKATSELVAEIIEQQYNSNKAFVEILIPISKFS